MSSLLLAVLMAASYGSGGACVLEQAPDRQGPPRNHIVGGVYAPPLPNPRNQRQTRKAARRRGSR